MALTDNPMSLVVTSDVTIGAALEHTKYLINIGMQTGGTIITSANTAPAGEKITFTAEPHLGYKFGEWGIENLTTGEMQTETVNPLTYTMPESDIEVNAAFIEVSYILTPGTLGVAKGYATSSYSGMGNIGSLSPTDLNGYTIIAMLSRWYNNQNFLEMSISNSQPFSSITVTAASNGATVTLSKSGSTLYRYTYGSSTNDSNMHAAVSAGGKFVITAK